MSEYAEIAALYSDGGVISKNPSPIGGTWAWCQVDASGERLLHASGVVRPFMSDGQGGRLPVTNNNTEMIALTRGLLSLPEGWSGTVYCDSKCALGWTFWGYKHENVPTPLIEKARAAVARLGKVETVLLDGHPTAAQIAAGTGKRGQPVSIHNKFCDEECTKAGAPYKVPMAAKASPSRERVRETVMG
ncbi:MAG: hypothetical protein ABIY70_08745 [Capsulimonas sp.]|uniref:hypothetical protein n=1 Tax=Capsulimonas sp. TaxID=2494211 RepID=UPI0032652D0D